MVIHSLESIRLHRRLSLPPLMRHIPQKTHVAFGRPCLIIQQSGHSPQGVLFSALLFLRFLVVAAYGALLSPSALALGAGTADAARDGRGLPVAVGPTDPFARLGGGSRALVKRKFPGSPTSGT